MLVCNPEYFLTSSALINAHTWTNLLAQLFSSVVIGKINFQFSAMLQVPRRR